MTTEMQKTPAKKAVQTNPNKFIAALFMRAEKGEVNPLKQFVSFEQNKNGTIAMYMTNIYTLPLERYSINQRPVFVKVLADQKKNAKGIIQNSAYAMSILIANFKSWFKPGKDKYEALETDSKGKQTKVEKDVVMPFNAAVISGHITSTLVPTLSLNRKAYTDFLSYAMQVYAALNKEPVGSQNATKYATKLLEAQKIYVDGALARGDLQMSQVVYAERDGVMPILALNSSMNSSSNKLLNINTYRNEEEVNASIEVPAHTNSWGAYIVVDMGTQFNKSSNGVDLNYGISKLMGDNGTYRLRFMREAIIYDGQGNEQRITIEHVNANYGDGGRAQALEDNLKSNNNIHATGQLTAYPAYGDKTTLASRFNLVIDSWFINNQPNQSTLEDNGFEGDVDVMTAILNADTQAADGTAVDELIETDLSKLFETGERQRAPARQPVTQPVNKEPVTEGVDDTDYNDDLPF